MDYIELNKLAEEYASDAMRNISVTLSKLIEVEKLGDSSCEFREMFLIHLGLKILCVSDKSRDAVSAAIH